MDIQKLKAELIEEIMETIHEELASMNACALKKADETAGKAVNEGVEMPVDEKAKPEAVEETKEGAGATETAAEVKEQTAEEKVEKPAEEKKDEEPAKEEVIKIETLNSSPIPTLNSRRPAWKDMKPDEFIRWIDSGAYKTSKLD